MLLLPVVREGMVVSTKVFPAIVKGMTSINKESVNIWNRNDDDLHDWMRGLKKFTSDLVLKHPFVVFIDSLFIQVLKLLNVEEHNI